jgi:hypothetical protein
MARRPDPPLGTLDRLELDAGRYLRVYGFVRDRISEGNTLDDAYGKASKELRRGRSKFPLSTVKKHHLRMRRSIEAAKAAGLNVQSYERPTRPTRPPLPDSIWTEADAEDTTPWLMSSVLGHKQMQVLQDHAHWEAPSKDPISYAFDKNERAQLNRVKRAFAQQLARERLELVELRKQLSQRKKR